MANFYLDHNVSHRVADLLRQRGHEVATARQLDYERLSDDAQFLFATRHSWLLVTHNEDDFVLLRDAWHRWSTEWGVAPVHAGIIIVPPADPAGTVQRITALLAACDELGLPLDNELYQWRNEGDWIRRPKPPPLPDFP